MARIVLAGLITLLSLSAFAAPELKGSPQDLKGFLYPNDKIVTISGTAEEKAYSDKAIISVVITTESKLLSEAIASNAALRKQVADSLVRSGVSPGAINSSKFSSSPQYGWFGKKPSSYKVVNRMAISITDESHLEDIASIADELKEAELSATEFEHTKKDEFNEKVKASALEKILKRKAFYEQTLGVKLTPVGIRDSSIRQRATRGAMVLEEVVVSAAISDENNYSSMAKMRDQARDSSFDEVRYEATMSVDFKIAE